MKVLLISSIYQNAVVGPARFAKLLESNSDIDAHILTSNVKETATCKSVSLDFKWWQKKLKNYFSIGPYTKRINELKSNYDFLIYNSSILVDPKRLDSSYIVMVNDEKLANVSFRFRFDYLRRLLHRKLEKRAVQKASKVIVNSDYMKTRIARTYQIPEHKMYTLYKGIDLKNKTKVFEDNLSSTRPIQVLFVKNDYIIGGLLDLIKALKDLTEFNFELTILGTGEEVHKVIKPFDHVTYNVKGYTSNNTVIEEMYNHDILCIPARHEPLGVAVMEGLAVGIPTVTTNVGGLPEVTQNGEHVWPCNPGDPNDLARQLRKCIKNSTLRKEKSKHAKAFIHKTFGFDSVVTNLKSILSKG
ncbi:MAG: glycosyltransferase family 4 protein [Saprospiraceae bacterium]|nr:glycosyltransferase family 4 protein [Saprospiraceae bacterium]